MAAKVYNAPSNPFRRSIMQRAQGGGAASSATGKPGAPLVNPLSGSALGDPSLNQNFGGGVIGGLLQARQASKQHEAYQQDQQSQDEALQAFQGSLQQGNAPFTAMMNMMREDPKHFMTLHRSGVLDTVAGVQGWMQQADSMSKAGQVTSIPTPNGGAVMQIMGPDGKPHYVNAQPQDNKLYPTGAMDPNTKAPIMQSGKSGQTFPLEGAVPQSTFNSEERSAATDTRATQKAVKPNWDPAHSRYVYPPGADGKPTIVPVDQPTINLSSRDQSFYGGVGNLYKALGDLKDLSNDVTDPLTGKVTTLAAKLTGEGKEGVAWNSALTSARNTLASMREGSGYVSGMKEQLDNLPKDWQSARQNIATVNRLQQDLQQKTGLLAASAEANGRLPDAVADNLGKMGVFTQKFAPALGKLRQDPDSMSTDDIRSIANYGPYMAPEERQGLKDQITKRMQQSAGQASQPPPAAAP